MSFVSKTRRAEHLIEKREKRYCARSMGEVRLACFLSHDGNHSRRRSSTAKTAHQPAAISEACAEIITLSYLGHPKSQRGGGERTLIWVWLFLGTLDFCSTVKKKHVNTKQTNTKSGGFWKWWRKNIEHSYVFQKAKFYLGAKYFSSCCTPFRALNNKHQSI